MSNRLRRLAAPLLLPVVALWAGPLAAAPKVVPTTSTTPQVVPMHRVKVALPSGTQTTADGRFHYTSQIVIDGNTGLTWERAPSESKRDWSASKSYCGALNLGGKSDWRVPRVEELKSLFAKVGTDTHLVAGHPFTVSTQERWTASGDPARRFGLLVGNGNYFNHPVADTLAVWCVRGGDNTAYPGSNLRFPYVEGSNYKQVLDTQTGLVWRTQPTALGDWFKARGECRDVGVGWRLATRAEYDALLDPSAPGAPKLPTGHPFQNVWSPDYDGQLRWSSTQPKTATATVVSLADGGASTSDKATGNHSGFCVKGDTSATRFTLVDDGASVLDQETQIVWTRAIAYDKKSWDDQAATCSARPGGWRLPSLREYGTIVEYPVQGTPKLVAGHLFTGARTDSYQNFWTIEADQYTAYKTFDIATAQPRAYSKNNLLYGWCLRSNLP